MAENSREVVLRWFDEVWNQRRRETIDELMTEESVCYMDQGAMRGPTEFIERQYLPLTNAFPDLQVQVDDIVALGDNVVVRWTARGTHTGDGLPIPPTLRQALFTGMSWIRVRDGKFKEGWQASNIEEVIRRLASPAPIG